MITWIGRDQVEGAGHTYSGGTAPALAQLAMRFLGGVRPQTSRMRASARLTGMPTAMARSRVWLKMWHRHAGWSRTMVPRPLQHPAGALDVPASLKKARHGLSSSSDPMHVADTSTSADGLGMAGSDAGLEMMGPDGLEKMDLGSDVMLFFAESAAVATARASSRRRTEAAQVLPDDAIVLDFAGRV